MVSIENSPTRASGYSGTKNSSPEPEVANEIMNHMKIEVEQGKSSSTQNNYDVVE